MKIIQLMRRINALIFKFKVKSMAKNNHNLLKKIQKSQKKKKKKKKCHLEDVRLCQQVAIDKNFF